MAPEQAIGEPELDGRADQYALACVLFELLTGRLPVEETNDARRITRQLQEAPPDVRDLAPTVPAAVARVLARALSPTPWKRFRFIEGFSGALEAAARGQEPRFSTSWWLAPSAQPKSASPARTRRSWGAWAAAMAVAIGMAVLGGRLHPGSAPNARARSAPAHQRHS
jgi:serine/threonine protein kinase